jgi:iron complex outermembrane recepter protein
MKFQLLRSLTLVLSLFCCCSLLSAQTKIKGKVFDTNTGESLIGATVVIKNSTIGTVTNYDGAFELTVQQVLPYVTLTISYVGYDSKEVIVTDADVKNVLTIKLGDKVNTIGTVEVVGQSISEKTKASPVTIEQLGSLAIKNASSVSFYDEAGKLKGVDLTTASIGFTIINTRGFNSTSPVRSLQIIDGVDNQSPGLNFSLGNFLGSSELDVNKLDLIVGANSAYYGPNAFNGVISMETKNPFYQKGLSASLKYGERNLTEVAIRWADAFKNRDNKDWFAYKFNFSYLRANDWVADNYEPTANSRHDKTNPGRFDAVNIYGDEYNATFNQTPAPGTFPDNNIGLGAYYRTGYKEKDLVDYNTKNLKANVAFHIRLDPQMEEKSPELIIASNLGNGTTVYQGDNRFSLRDILFFQNRIELRQRDKFFIRAYATNEDAGKSYDPYYTALLLQQSAKGSVSWGSDYELYWANTVDRKARANGYPVATSTYNPATGEFEYRFDKEAAKAWLENPRFQDSLFRWHTEAEASANGQTVSAGAPFYQPGTDRFQEAFNRITSTKSSTRDNVATSGTRFFDLSALYHLHGEYKIKDTYFDEITVGGNSRLYRPNSDGTIFSDTNGRRISNFEFGVYGGIEKNAWNKKLKINATLRADKNQNFSLLFSPAASLVYQPDGVNFVRFAFSSAIRNPTLTDQYLNLNVGPATLRGNIDGAKDLVTVKSFQNYLGNPNPKLLDTFNIAPIRPEAVKSLEIGYRTTINKKLYLDASYYFSIYNDFIGYQIGITSDYDPNLRIPINTKVYRYAANSSNTVTTQGFSIGGNYYFAKYYQVSANYSWNKLNTKVDDPIIPAFNTPEHKYNVAISARDLHNFGFNFNYKWIQGFRYEGSPQFTGDVPTYDLIDGQVNYQFKEQHLTVKLGASNILDKRQFQVYGGPRIGRMAYIGITYDFAKKN